ncbi:hypothetical protein ACVNPS_00805 [Candidatus Bipolaricaulota sp. J31]
MAKIEGAFEQIDQRLGRLEAEVSQIRREVGEGFDELRRELRSIYRMVITVLIPMWVTIIGAIIGIALTR